MTLNQTLRLVSIIGGLTLLSCTGGDPAGRSAPQVERPRPQTRPEAMRAVARQTPAPPAPRRRVVDRTPARHPVSPPPKGIVSPGLKVINSLEGGEEKKLVAGANAFAAALYDRLRRKKGNVFFSPLSISSGLAMVRAGAAGRTLSQLKKVMRIKLDEETVHRGFNEQIVTLNGSAISADNVKVANSLWGMKDIRYGRKFLLRTQKYYGARLTRVDFHLDPAGAARQINAWVSKATNKRITRIVKKQRFSRLTRLVLINAIYFQADWKSKFDTSDTESRPFFLDHRRRRHVKVDTMYQMQPIGYYRKGPLRVGVIPYLNKDYAMVLLTYRGRLSRLEARLRTGKLLPKLLKKTSKQMVEVYLPRFSLSQGYRLVSTLRKMGLRDLFSRKRANLKPAAPGIQMHVSRILHKAYIKVDEEGTVAAAATTAIGADEENGEDTHPVLRCDSPFLFFLRHNPTGLILFAGRVSNPDPSAKIIRRAPRRIKRHRPRHRPRPRRRHGSDADADS